MARRLFVTGEGESLTYCIAETREEAHVALNGYARIPDSDDIRIIWSMARLDQMSFAEIQDRFGVCRQTVDYWFRKAGGDLKRRSDFLAQKREERVKELLHDRTKKRSVTSIAKNAGTSTTVVKEMADKLGVALKPARRRLTDDELVEMARGKTWPEFAEAVGLRLATLRTYVYSRPGLSERIREVRVKRTSGTAAHGKVEPKKLQMLHNKGMSAYAIALEFGVEQMVIRYWLRKLAQKETANAPTRKRRAADNAVGSSDGGAERHE